MNSTNTIIILLLILFILYIKQYQENFVDNIYGINENCNYYIPDYSSCNVVPTFDSDNIENFACPCSKK